MTDVLWKLRRLRAMMGAEIGWRLAHILQARLERLGLGLAQPGVPVGQCGRRWAEPLPRDFHSLKYVERAEAVLAGRFDVFALRSAVLGFPPNWNQDSKTGTVAPIVFGKTLNYRDEKIVGDIKYLWEPNRHAELVTLAQAWHLTGETRYVEGCRTLLDSWFESCRYPLGPNWTSSLEHAVRLVNWAVAWHLLGQDHIDGGLRQRWVESIYRHCHFIAGHLSRHSSANNHLLGELMGLFVASTVWPLWPESDRWREQANTEFFAEALRQNSEDGVNREQAIWYQHEVADMMLLVGLFGRRNGIEFPEAYWHRLERMLDFIAAVMDAGGNVPMIGDSDDARLVRFDAAGESNVYRSLLATGSVLFKRPDFALKAGRFDDKSRWLLGDESASTFDSMLAEASRHEIAGMTLKTGGNRSFPIGGYYVLGSDFETDREVRLVADAGPLGYLSIAAHGHADALAFTLSVGGREMLVDPGTYAYHTQKKWRDYFRGTSAHNTIRIDGVDQSVIGGNFLWTHHARAWCEQWQMSEEMDRFIGEHDGYLRLKDPLRHRRELTYSKQSGTIVVEDDLVCRGRHTVELFWHFAETCDVVESGTEFVANSGGTILHLSMDGMNGSKDIVRGREDPPLGWISRRFDVKVPTRTVVWAGSIEGHSKLRTTIRVVNG